MRFLADQNFDNNILRILETMLSDSALIDLRNNYDCVRVQDFAATNNQSDEIILAWAAKENRILLTHDRKTIPDFAYDRIDAGEAMAGVFIINDQEGASVIAIELIAVIGASEQNEWDGKVRYLPMF